MLHSRRPFHSIMPSNVHQSITNHLLPSPEFVYDLVRQRTIEPIKEKSTFLDRIRTWFIGPRVEAQTMTPMKRHLTVGIHGWFPNKWLQRVIGVPRGTSERLSEMMHEVCGGDAISLEGEGCIMERVGKHLEQVMQLHKHQFMEATDVYFVAHSQGCPVTAILIDKMLKEGWIDGRRQRIGFLALAGVFQGPLPSLRSNLVVQYVEADAARELFELNDPESAISIQLLDSLQRIISQGVRMMTTGSWLDQVVPVYSSCLLLLSHPSIIRLLYVDSIHHNPDFLNLLCLLSLKISALDGEIDVAQRRNAHLLLAHLTPYLSGQLLQHNAHSTLYDEHIIYRLAHHWFEKDVQDGHGGKDMPALMFDDIKQFSMKPDESSLDFVPWIVRGMLLDSSLTLHPLLKDDFDALPLMHSEWIPTTKELRHLKSRLAPLQHKI
jgi:hypothetical protein